VHDPRRRVAPEAAGRPAASSRGVDGGGGAKGIARIVDDASANHPKAGDGWAACTDGTGPTAASPTRWSAGSSPVAILFALRQATGSWSPG